MWCDQINMQEKMQIIWPFLWQGKVGLGCKTSHG